MQLHALAACIKAMNFLYVSEIFQNDLIKAICTFHIFDIVSSVSFYHEADFEFSVSGIKYLALILYKLHIF